MSSSSSLLSSVKSIWVIEIGSIVFSLRSEVVQVGGTIATIDSGGIDASSDLGARLAHLCGFLLPATGPGPRERLARFEVGDHGEHAAVIVLGLRQAQLLEDAVNVLLDRS